MPGMERKSNETKIKKPTIAAIAIRSKKIKKIKNK
jgi:hypothetical protein